MRLKLFLFRGWLIADVTERYTAQTQSAAISAQQAMRQNDTVAARRILTDIGQHPHVTFGCVYNANNLSLIAVDFSESPTNTEHCPPAPDDTQHTIVNHTLHSFHQVKIEDRLVGALHLRMDMRDINTKITHIAFAIFGIYALTVLLLYGITAQLSRHFTDPIHNLSQSLRKVLKTRDFNHRVDLERSDDMGKLSQHLQNLLNMTGQYAHQINHLTQTDVITGLPNRRMLMHHLENATSKLNRSGTPLAILMIHTHGLSAINQQLGHTDGDTVLKTVAERIRGCVRTGDVVARLGGNTFITLLREAPETWSIRAAATRITEQIQAPLALTAPPAKEDKLRLTAHIGISVAPHDEHTPSRLLKMAERATQSACASKASIFFSTEPCKLIPLQPRRQTENWNTFSYPNSLACMLTPLSDWTH